MPMEKKKWTPPKLVIIKRSNPEEMVLHNCKMNFVPSGPGMNFGGCYFLISGCASCAMLGAS